MNTNSKNVLSRIIEDGTISSPREELSPEYSLRALTNWIKALSILVKSKDICYKSALGFYDQAPVKHRKLSELEENSIFEQMFFAIHNTSALKTLIEASDSLGSNTNSDFSRMAILSWYYGQYTAATAMIIAQTGDPPRTHAKTAKTWVAQFSTSTNLIMDPFDRSVSTLVKKQYTNEISLLYDLDSSSHRTHHEPQSKTEALPVVIRYLKGTANWYRKQAEKNIRGSQEFKALGVENFRTKKARIHRDAVLSGQQIGYMHQAYRFRTKANYRDALYLAYQYNSFDINEFELNDFIQNLFCVLKAFVSMAGAFTRKKVGKEAWESFLRDVEQGRAFSMSVSELWT